MKVTNPHDQDVYVPAVGDVVAAGATVDVDTAIADALVAQGWTTKPRRSGSADKAEEATPEED